jgi:hypothetical protein
LILRLGIPNSRPTPAATSPASTNTIKMFSPGRAVVSLNAEYAPTAMKPPVPSDRSPAYPVRRFRPSAASE